MPVTNKGKNQPKALLLGGPLGRLIPLNLPKFRPASRGPRGLSLLGKYSLQILNDQDCLVSLARERVVLSLDHRQILCRPCREGLHNLANLLYRIINGQADETALSWLQDACTALQDQGPGHGGREVAAPILYLLKRFPEEFRLHAVNKFCPARVCPRLLPAPCHQTCPTNIDIPSYLALVAHGSYLEALEVIRQDNPFPWVCGLVCPHPCETACVRANLDNPINIKNLKAFVAEWAANHGRYLPLRPGPATGHKVAVVGSGPAGLSAAHFLALKGHQVTIFEALKVAGGTPGWGIPAYRLPRDILQREIENIKGMGVAIRLNSPIGPGRSINDLLTREGFEAVFLAVGAQDSVRLPVPGAEAQGIYWGVEFLREVSLNGKSPTQGQRVVVIGGGNVAIDVARVHLRVARISLERGATRVTMFCLESPEEMPASQWEVEEALEEGIEIFNRWGVKEVLTREGKVTGITLRKVARVFDEQGRFSPTYLEDQTMIAEADAVIFAIGQKVNLGFLSPGDDIGCTPRGLIQADPESLSTTRTGVFAAGDAVTGPATVVKAIAAGKQAALSIDHYLSQAPGPAPIFRLHKRQRVPFFPIHAPDKIRDGRVPMPQLDPHDRIMDFAPIELGYTETQAQKEARRCLRCDVCIRCGACEKVCRDEMKVHALEFKPISDTERILSDYLRPGERCITCGACALVCPTGAIEYLETQDRREVRLCGSVLNQMKTSRCQACGAPFVPSRYLSYVTQHSDAAMGKQVLRRWCPKCARAKRAAEFIKF